MATYSFFQSAQGDPTRSQRRLGRQTADGIPYDTSASWIDFLHYGGAQNLTPNKLERQAITNGSMLRASILGKTDVNLSYNMGDLDAGNTAQAAMFYSFFSGYENVATLSGDAKRHQMGAAISTDTMSQKLSVVHDNDDGMPYRITDVVPAGFTLSLVPRLSSALFTFEGVGRAINYGLDKVRFPSFVRPGDRIRARGRVAWTRDASAGGVLGCVHYSIEVEGRDTPACVVEALMVAFPPEA